MAQAAAKTGAGPTVMVAIEQHFPSRQRIITDDLAYSVLPFGARALVWAMRPPLARNRMVRATERAFPGLWSGIMCRKRYIDEALIAASREIDREHVGDLVADGVDVAVRFGEPLGASLVSRKLADVRVLTVASWRR